MGIMNTVIVIIKTMLVPVLAVIMAVIVFNMMKAPGRSKVSEDSESFKVTESSFWVVIAVFSAVAGVLLIWLGFGHEQMSQAVTAYIVGGLCLAIAIVTCYIYFRRSLTVNSEEFVYQPIWGKSGTYKVKTVGRVDVVTTPRYDEYRFYNKSGKELFVVQGYMVNSSVLLKFMKKRPVRMTKKTEEK